MDSFIVELIRFYNAIQKFEYTLYFCKTKNIAFNSGKFQLFLDNPPCSFWMVFSLFLNFFNRQTESCLLTAYQST